VTARALSSLATGGKGMRPALLWALRQAPKMLGTRRCAQREPAAKAVVVVVVVVVLVVTVP